MGFQGFRVQGSGFRVQGFRVQGFRVQGFRVQGFRVPVLRFRFREKLVPARLHLFKGSHASNVNPPTIEIQGYNLRGPRYNAAWGLGFWRD